ncbi:hypothetical protein GCM10010840_10550 [Deinococcus aerolatus]|uniref:Ferredoxin n=1 Tax=Deinococcus aerolatus TaxID=522487 RepID=A0ABQ2G4I7_9DEIO|nr:ferredoxin family protein [Deinococcus aerolatus]GGL74341.1 hypothetical protein GCM10010840_10550 [Deinococcus aerolatus]
MTHIITSPCIGTKDASCTEVCPVECIYDAGELYLIHPDECIDCGACVPACPVSAILAEEAVVGWITHLKLGASVLLCAAVGAA